MTAEIKIDVEKFKQDGYLVVNNFLSQQEVDELKNETKRIVDEMARDETRTLFVTEAQKTLQHSEYFLTSGDKVRFFFEDCFDENGNFKVPKERALYRLGFGLHIENPVFKKHVSSDKIKSVLRQLGMKKPAVIQSQYIFKQPHIGSPVLPHQDSTYQQTEPDNVVGLWTALETSTTDNGCLSFIPGSHKNGTYRRWVRNSDPNGPLCVYEGKPYEYDATKWVPISASAGTLVLIHGQVMHQSGPNHSSQSREIYTFHAAETVDTEYCKGNWLQLPYDFPLVYDD